MLTEIKPGRANGYEKNQHLIVNGNSNWQKQTWNKQTNKQTHGKQPNKKKNPDNLNMCFMKWE